MLARVIVVPWLGLFALRIVLVRVHFVGAFCERLPAKQEHNYHDDDYEPQATASPIVVTIGENRRRSICESPMALK
jgi:hypothetical protein